MGKVTIPHRFAEPPLHKGAFLGCGRKKIPHRLEQKTMRA